LEEEERIDLEGAGKKNFISCSISLSMLLISFKLKVISKKINFWEKTP